MINASAEIDRFVKELSEEMHDPAHLYLLGGGS